MKRVLLAGAVLVGLLVLALTLRIRAQDEAQNGPPGGAGVIEAVAVDIGTRIPGRITKLSAREGTAVHAGDALLELDCMQERARLAEADARIEAANAQVAAANAAVQTASRSTAAASAAARATEARISAATVHQETATREAARVASLGSYASGQSRDMAQSQAAGASSEVEAARAQSRAQRAQIGVARAQIEAADAQARATASNVRALEALRELARIAVDECVVRAPRDGIVEDVYFEEGEIVSPGAIVVRLVDLREVRATFYLPNAELAEARTDREAELIADAWPGQRFAGRVITVANEAEFTPRNIQTRTDRDRLVYAIEIAVPNPDGHLRPGMPVQVTLR
jgi:HlyD family secretion protein